MLQLEETAEGGVLVVAPKGRLDSAASPGFGERLAQLAQAPSARLVLDLGGVDFLSSAGLRVILSTLKTLKAGQGRMAVCAVQPPVLEVLEISGFAALLSIHPGRSGALEALA